jgi:hypothetical protein
VSWLGLLLMTVAGAGVLRLGLGGARCGARWLELGGGFVLGFVLLGAMLGMLEDVPLAALRWPGLLGLVGVALASGTLLAWRTRSTERAPRPLPFQREGLWPLLLLALMLLLFAALLLLQVWSLPTLAWDGWNAWLAKLRAWVEARHLLPAVVFGEWLAAPAGSTLAVAGAAYPEALPRALAWLLAWHGGWNERLAHLPWAVLWPALGALCYGGLRGESVPRLAAGLTCLLLLSLPLVTAHVVLSGYADLWLASLILLALLVLLRFGRTPGWGPPALFLVCLILLPQIKLEGAIYALLLAAAALLWRLPAALRWALIGLVALLPLALWLGWTVAVPAPGLGWVMLRSGAVELPIIGVLELHWRPVAGAVAHALFVLPSFSLLWYLVPAVVVLRWRRALGSQLAPGLAFLAGAGLFHFLLFFFTEASAWAENLTSLNRLLLHVVPSWTVMLCLLLAEDEISGTQRYGRFAKSPRPPASA